MPQSLSQLYAHLIFSTRERQAWLTPPVQDRLFPYLAGALQAQDCPALKVGGHVDHVHLLFRLSKNKVASRVVGDIKGEGTKWVKREFAELQAFGWQSGYGLFSVSASQVETVKAYIANQAEHHRTMTFQEEFRRLLERSGMEYDERYVWD